MRLFRRCARCALVRLCDVDPAHPDDDVVCDECRANA
jgi:hypothetical protein